MIILILSIIIVALLIALGYLYFKKQQPLRIETKYSFGKVEVFSDEDEQKLAGYPIALDLISKLIETKIAQQAEDNNSIVRFFPSGAYDIKSEKELYIGQGIISGYATIKQAINHIKTKPQQ